MLDEVAAYLVLAPVGVVLVAGVGVLAWRMRRRYAVVRTARRSGSRKLTD